MQCFDCTEWLSLQLDGLVEQQQREQLQAHLASCESCRAEWEAMQRVSSVLEAASEVAPPLDFAAKVASRLQQREARQRRVRGGIGLLEQHSIFSRTRSITSGAISGGSERYLIRTSVRASRVA